MIYNKSVNRGAVWLRGVNILDPLPEADNADVGSFTELMSYFSLRIQPQRFFYQGRYGGKSMKATKTKRIVESGLLIAMATVLTVLSMAFPLKLPFGGSVTLLSMLPIVLLSYRHGIKWGICSGFVFSLIQIATGIDNVKAFFVPEDYKLTAALGIIFLDYIAAYTVVGLGGFFRNRIKNPSASLALGAAAALSFRYICHIISGAVFFGMWAEWFFSQYEIGDKILSTFSGASLSLIYSVVYNGLFMIPEIILTVLASIVIGKIPAICKRIQK